MPLLLLFWKLVCDISMTNPRHKQKQQEREEGKGKLCVEWCKPPQIYLSHD